MRDSKFWAVMPVWYLFLSAIVFDQMLHVRHQSQRKWWTPLFLTISILSSTSSTKYFWFFPPLMSLWTQAVTLYILHILSLLFIERWPTPDLHRDYSRSESRSASHGIARYYSKQRFYTTYRLWGNPRVHCVNRDTVHPERLTIINQGARQSTFSFVSLRFMKLSFYYYTYFQFAPIIFKKTIVSILPNDVGPAQQVLLRRLNEVTPREVTLRLYYAILWIWESVVFLDGANAILAIVFVLTGIDEPEDWPTLFNSPGSATGLQRFWSCFWHRLATRPYKNVGKILASRVFCLQSETIPYNTIVALVVFSLSGVTHAITAWQCGLHDWHLDIEWFLLNFFGCLIERSFAVSIRGTAKQIGWSRRLREIEESWFGRLVGYSWVFAFFFWSVPKWRYPRLEQEALAYENLRDFVVMLQGL